MASPHGPCVVFPFLGRFKIQETRYNTEASMVGAFHARVAILEPAAVFSIKPGCFPVLMSSQRFANCCHSPSSTMIMDKRASFDCQQREQ